MSHEKHENREPLLFAEEAFRIQGAIFEVSRQMGIGFLEAVYQECLTLELAARGIPFAAHRPLTLNYRGQNLQQTYIPDLICFDEIILELKAVQDVAPQHRAQLLNYLRATNLRLGLLVNFGCAPKARVERIIL